MQAQDNLPSNVDKIPVNLTSPTSVDSDCLLKVSNIYVKASKPGLVVVIHGDGNVVEGFDVAHITGDSNTVFHTNKIYYNGQRNVLVAENLCMGHGVNIIKILPSST